MFSFSSGFFSLREPEFSVRRQPILSKEASSFGNDISNQDEVTVTVLGLVLHSLLQKFITSCKSGFLNKF